MNETALERFQAQRPLLFSVAYRMLGSASDAEDVVQDAWLRFSAAQPAQVRSPKAFLTTIVTRLCLDRLKSARASREAYVGPWLPEPVVTDEQPGPERSMALSESVTLAFMVLLETLSPEERAVFLLREVFEHDYADIAAMLETTSANCRQLFHRAKERLAEKRPRFRGAAAAKRPLVDRFVQALRTGDAEAFTSVLAADVGFWSDGGGKVLAARRPVHGRAAVANMLAGFRRTAPAAGVDPATVSLYVVDVNGEPAMLMRIAGRLDSVYTFTIDDDAISAIRVVRNPDKLRYLERQLTVH
ncbi:MAG TPA: RNA polymerase sigma-70 factor [Vicinamibacterales bacterium]|nr:RNA polymerase sigma-70 factor [Vicinamibacterales bacterium]